MEAAAAATRRPEGLSQPSFRRIQAFHERRHACGSGCDLVPAHVSGVRVGRLDPAGLLVFPRWEKEQTIRYGSLARPFTRPASFGGAYPGVILAASLCLQPPVYSAKLGDCCLESFVIVESARSYLVTFLPKSCLFIE